MSSPYSEARRNLLEKLLRGQAPLTPAIDAIPRRDPNEPVPLSYAQEQIWLHAQLAPDLPLYNEPVSIDYSGDLNVAALEQAFNDLLRRHEAWRTSFKLIDGQARQDVKPELSISLPVVDLRHLPEKGREPMALSIATADSRIPLDLTQAPLFTARLIRLADRHYRLQLTLCHIIFDGVAIYRIFLPELDALYRARLDGSSVPLPELKIQYPDYSCWQRKSLRPESLAPHLSYWQRQLGSDLPVLNLPADYARPPVQTFRGGLHTFTLSPSLTEAARALCRQEGVTAFQALLAGFAALLCRYSGQQDFPIGSVTAGRDRPETSGLLGYFLNTIVLRMNLTGDPSFHDLLRHSRNLTLEALEHDSVPLSLLVNELNAPRDLSRNPLFQVMFSLDPQMPDLDPAWHLEQTDADTGTTKCDLYIELHERRNAIFARLHYSTDLFEHDTIVRMAEHWITLLEAAIRDAGLRISQLPMLSEQEKTQICIEWNQTQVPSEKKSIHDLFDAQCERTPSREAIREADKRLDYRQLQDRSNRLAHYLQKLGAAPGTRVALCIERSLDMFVALLAILKTGAAYVPLDPSYPPDRIQHMLLDSNPVVLITQHKLVSNVPMNRITTVAIDADWHKIARESSHRPSVDLSIDVPSADRAYVLYTSGSSGRPKGVEGTHRGAINRMQWMWERYPFQAGEVCCQKTNVGFVDSVWEIFGPLLAGVPSVILRQEALLDPEEMLRTLAEHRVTRIVLVPSLLRALLEHAPNLQERVPHLKLWTCSGEVLKWELAEKFQKAHPAATLLNIYGSSEVAADVTCHDLTPHANPEPSRRDGASPVSFEPEKEAGQEKAPGVAHSLRLMQGVGATATTAQSQSPATGSVPIGRPISNTQLYVLDEHLNPVPVGVRGEIYVGGDGLARGYWRQPELTAERFTPNPIAPERSAKLYRTGDLGRWRKRKEGGGEIEYLGRRDSEVKVRGMRIELGEIETVLSRHEWIQEAVVELSGEGVEQRLTAYVVGTEKAGTKEAAAPSARELRRYVRTKLPEHMVPASFVKLESLPLLSSGKVNRRALAAMPGVGLAEQGIVAPRTVVEQKLAEMWAEVLKVKEVGVDQNFFELGGHSLLVLQVMARIRREFDVELGVRTMFEEPTIAGLGIEVEKARALGMKSRTPALERRPRPAAANVSREALLAQLDTLSADDVQTLLKDVLDAKPLQ
jgi:non-ribosomal peptide synthetase component F/acyl carrier protein